MAIQSTTTTPPVAATIDDLKPKTTAAGTDKNALGKDDFLKLMVAQMKNQDPMNPADDKDNIAQMAQFSSLEQITNLANATQELATRLSLTQNVGLLGHTVTYTGADGKAVSGTVDGLDLGQDGTTTLSVAGQAGVDPSGITSVR
jgi:flagellar basal-body rod modification protein FlgD